MKHVIAIVILFLTINLQAQDMPGMKMPMQKKEKQEAFGEGDLYLCYASQNSKK